MAGMRGFGKTLTSQVLPAAGGGAAAGVLTKVLGDKVVTMLPANMQPYGETIKSLLPGVVGVYLMQQKSPAMKYAGAGMIGKSIGDVAEQVMPLGDDVLADQAEELDELFEEVEALNDEYEEDDDEDYDDYSM